MRMGFTGTAFEWRGPAPYVFVRLPEAEGADLAEMPELSYGWGCIAARGRIGDTDFTTALIPRDGGYLLPLKVAVRRAEGIELGMEVAAEIWIEEAD